MSLVKQSVVPDMAFSGLKINYQLALFNNNWPLLRSEKSTSGSTFGLQVMSLGHAKWSTKAFSYPHPLPPSMSPLPYSSLLTQGPRSFMYVL